MTKKKMSLVALILIAMIVTVFATGYFLGSLIGQITVTEPITWTPTEFSTTLNAGETATQEITVSNVANVELNVSITISVDSPANIFATADESIVVPAGGSAILTVTIGAYPYATPDTYTVTVDFNR